MAIKWADINQLWRNVDYGSALRPRVHGRFLSDAHLHSNSGKMCVYIYIYIYILLGEEGQIANGVAGQDVVDEEDSYLICTSRIAVLCKRGRCV